VNESGQDRYSEAASAFLIADPEERARREAENGLKQFDSVIGLVQRFLAERWRFALPYGCQLYLAFIVMLFRVFIR
jgi:hypothetical protein